MRRAPSIAVSEVEMEQQTMPTPATLLLANDSPSLFREGFYTPSVTTFGTSQQGLPWKSVREVIEMADNALKAKQRAAEKLARQLEVLRQQGATDKLLKRAQRAEVDSGSLLDELQQLIQAKADAAQQRADLDRANTLLMAERELLCEQLQVPSDVGNLCQAVSKVLATARRVKGLDVQLRLLAKCQRELLLQLEAQREAAARAERAGRQWQAEKQAYLQLLAEHGIKPPALPEQAGTAAASLAAAATAGGDDASASSSSAAAGEPAAGVMGLASSSSIGSSTAALTAHLMLIRMQSGEHMSDSPQAHLPPGTPPVHDLGPLAQGTPPMPMVRRSHSLDSGLNSLTGLLDQLALGQLCGSEEGTDLDGAEDCDSWTMADAMSADMEPWSGGGAGSSGSSSFSQAAGFGEKMLLVQPLQQQHLQPVLEGAEECC